MIDILRRVGGFSMATLGPAAISLLAVPVLIRATSQDEWAAIAVGQAAGTVAGILVGLGWGFNGPTVVARADPVDRAHIAADSLVARAVAAPIVIAVACAVSALLRPDHAVVAIVSCLGVALLGLGMNWFFIGAGDVRALLVFDAFPRIVATTLGAGATWVTGSAIAFVIVSLIGAIYSVIASAVFVTANTEARWAPRRALQGVRAQASASITVVTAAAYLAMPTLVVAALAPDAVFVYALADRITRLAFMAISPVYQWMQGWVPAASDLAEMRRRIVRALRLSVGIAVAVGAGIVALAPAGGRILGGADVHLAWTLTVPLAISVGMSALSRCSGMVCLLALGDDRTVAVSAVLGAAVGVPLLVAMIPMTGAPGAAVAVMMSEIVVAAFQGVRLRRRLRSDSATPVISTGTP